MLDYPHGTDMEWLAVDRDGRVAVFTTAGAGPVPVSVLEFERADEDEAELSGWDLLALPVVSEVRFYHDNTAYDFAEWAWRGLFAFDWKDGGRAAGRTGAYQRRTAPVTPTVPADLPPALATRAACCKLPLQFAETASIRVEDFVPVVTFGR